MKTHSYSVCIVASKSRVIYIGMTNNLERHVYEHKNDLVDGFSKKYREKQLKHWSRTKKIWLIERQNPTWDDLAAELFTKHMYQPDKQVPPLAS
jgi:putative endonuclease